MELKQLCKWVVICGALLIWTIKLIIRPLEIWHDANFFWGIAPNLIGSFLLPFGAYWLFSGKDFLLARLFRIRSVYDLRIFCLVGLGMLIINEYLQLLPVFGRTFDIFDMVFSFAGLMVAYFTFGRLQLKYETQAS